MQENIYKTIIAEEPLISIIVPVYNVERYIDGCLSSITNQLYKNIEVLVVDDGSPDRSLQICREWEKKDSRIIVIHQDNMGLSRARNTGLEHARGEYIAFVDSDDMISDSYISLMYNTAVNTQSDIVGCNATSIYSDMYQSGKVQEIKYVISEEPLLFYMENESDAVWHRLYKSNLLNNIRFEVGEQNEDVLFSFMVFRKSERYVTLSCKLYYWNLVPPSLSRCSVKSLKNQAARVVNILKNDKADAKLIDAARVRSSLFVYRLITRSLRFGLANWNIKQEYNRNIVRYREQLATDRSLIIKSSRFRVVDKIQVTMIIHSYSLYSMTYKILKKTRKTRGGITCIQMLPLQSCKLKICYM